MRTALQWTATYVLVVLLICVALVMAGSAAARIGPAGVAGSAVVMHATPAPHP